MRTIDESRAILERWGDKTGGVAPEPVMSNDGTWRTSLSRHAPERKGTLIFPVTGQSFQHALSAAADRALQDCPEIGEWPEFGGAVAVAPTYAGLADQMAVTHPQHTKPPTSKYPAFEIEEARRWLAVLRDSGRSGQCFNRGHGELPAFTFAEAVAHCAEHGLDVSEFREKPAIREAHEPTLAEKASDCHARNPHEGAVIYCHRSPGHGRVHRGWLYHGRDRTEVEWPVAAEDIRAGQAVYKCPECGKVSATGTCAHDATYFQAKTSRAEAAERIIERYPGWTVGDLKSIAAEHGKAVEEAAMRHAQAQARLDEAKQEAAKRGEAIVSARGAFEAFMDALAWLEEGKPR